MKRLPQIIAIGLIIIFSSCSNKGLMEYYYPIHKTSEVKIYKYINPKNIELTEYWKVTTNPIQKTILTESFNSKFNLYNRFEEKVTNKKAELFKYIDYEENLTIKQIEATVKDNQVYQSNKSKSYSYVVEYVNKYGRFRFEKKRQFVGFEETEIQGKKYQTAKFRDKYSINAIDIKDIYEFNQTTYYAQGIGMVKYERFTPTGEIKILELEQILTEKEFEALKKEKHL